jgi:hypothetical protein
VQVAAAAELRSQRADPHPPPTLVQPGAGPRDGGIGPGTDRRAREQELLDEIEPGIPLSLVPQPRPQPPPRAPEQVLQRRHLAGELMERTAEHRVGAERSQLEIQ